MMTNINNEYRGKTHKEYIYLSSDLSEAKCPRSILEMVETYHQFILHTLPTLNQKQKKIVRDKDYESLSRYIFDIVKKNNIYVCTDNIVLDYTGQQFYNNVKYALWYFVETCKQTPIHTFHGDKCKKWFASYFPSYSGNISSINLYQTEDVSWIQCQDINKTITIVMDAEETIQTIFELNF